MKMKMDVGVFENKYPWDVNGFRSKKIVKRIKDEVVNITTGEILDTPAIITHKIYDSKKFTKVYSGLIRAKYGFKPATQRIIDFIIANIPQDTPIIGINLNILTAYFRGLESDVKLGKNKKIMSLPTYYNALKELQESDIIYPTGSGSGSFWYVNANIIHNGKRIAVLDIIERQNTKQQDNASIEQQTEIFDM